ncbi:hypothetical protein ACHAQH_003585 [Verticillium albo-atrum]
MGRKQRTTTTLSRGRPPTLRHKAHSISRKETRTLINTHHTLQKKRQQAISRNDEAAVAAIDAEIASLGGLAEYQRASLQGQRNDRGGDSSKVLLEWLKPAFAQVKAASLHPEQRFRMLEVGALSTGNECSRSGLFDMKLIDLNSQHDDILQQDFMERPIPTSDNERFEIVSLSLVLNYVPDPSLRGQMLHRTLAFLREPRIDLSGNASAMFPALFLVLPRSCVHNSRYCSLERLGELMALLGYTQIQAKYTNKLAYFLWRRTEAPQNPLPVFAKREVNPGGDRNNFAIVLNRS